MATSTTKSVKAKREKKDINYPAEFFGKETVKTYIVSADDDPIIGCFNGHNWAVEVNKDVEIPVTIHDIIKQVRKVLDESKEESKAYTTGAGKNLTNEE